MDILSKLFGTSGRVKILRLFLFNEGTPFSIEAIADRTKLPKHFVRKEVHILQKIQLIQSKSFIEEKVITKGRGKQKKILTKKKRVDGYIAHGAFIYKEKLTELLSDFDIINRKKLADRFVPLGKIQLLTVSGIFLGERESSLDILIVGDKLKRNAIEQEIKTLEAEFGKELGFAILTTEDFLYRVSVFDKFVKDVLDFPHERLVQKIQIF